MRDNDITLLFSVSSDDGLVVSGGFEPHQQRSGAGGVETLADQAARRVVPSASDTRQVQQ